jgi:hypothetical protein
LSFSAGAVHEALVKWLRRPSQSGINKLLETLVARDRVTVEVLRERHGGEQQTESE